MIAPGGSEELTQHRERSQVPVMALAQDGDWYAALAGGGDERRFRFLGVGKGAQHDLEPATAVQLRYHLQSPWRALPRCASI